MPTINIMYKVPADKASEVEDALKAHAEHMEQHLHWCVPTEQLGRTNRHRHQHQQVNQRVDGEKISPQPRVREQDHCFDAHRRHNQRLVVAQTDAKPEKRPVQVTHPRRVLRPAV